jgi:AraC-like DNA-binding protein
MKTRSNGISDISDRMVAYILSRGIDDLADLNVNAIARKFGMNRSYLSERFNMDKKVPMHRYILMIKLLRSLSLLEQGGITVEEVSRKMGFSGTDYFRKVFKQMMGTTPGNYRSWYRKTGKE